MLKNKTDLKEFGLFLYRYSFHSSFSLIAYFSMDNFHFIH